MDKTAIKKYAVWARRELIERVSQKALQYGISADGKADPNADSVNERVLTDAEKKQRKELIRKVNAHGYEQVMEEIAYTWFNRFAALRFMEVNVYLPSHVRVFTNDEGEFKPQILSEAIHLDLDGLNMDRVYELKNANKDEELFKYLLVTQCNALSPILPKMFQHIADDTELLLPDYLLREGSVIHQMIAMIPEEDWKDQVQIIGWLYQYYNTEPKDKVFADLKKNIKISKENIPAATQLFTPDWIVRYMVENSLGRLWLEGHPNNALKSEWRYYLDEAEQETSVRAQLDAIRREYAALKPEDIKCIDPCMGSGHILCYLFDVLMQIYESQGYSRRDAAQNIVRHNLYGLDIDKRAAQLAYFSVMMKARRYDRRFFSRNLQPMVYSTTGNEDGENFGSLVMVDNPGEMPKDPQTVFEAADYENRLNVWSYRYLLAQKYHVVVTNPPYMGASGMNSQLAEFVKKNYPDSKSDASTAFMERTLQLCLPTGFMAMINIPVWMFLSSYEKLRHKMLSQNTISSMVHPGRGIFGSDFGTTTFVIAKCHIKNYAGTYRRLFEKQGEVESIEVREQAFLSGKGAFTAQQDSFSKIPGSPVAYWVSESIIQTYQNNPLMESVAPPKQGSTLGINDLFLRLWFEVSLNSSKWFPCVKGGEFRRWYGNHYYLINWENDGRAVKSTGRATIRNADRLFTHGIHWSRITSGNSSFRRLYNNFFFESAAGVCFPPKKDINYILGLLNTKISTNYGLIVNPTLTLQSGDVATIPVADSLKGRKKVESIVENNIAISRADWDSFETSWDFTRHPLVSYAALSPEKIREEENSGFLVINGLADAYHRWEQACADRFAQLKANEEELNRIFIDIYGLQDELTPEVEDKDVTVRRADLGRDIRSLISYAVGCMFGRYSPYKEGLIYAGGEWDYNQYENMAWLAKGKPDAMEFYKAGTHFSPDQDNIIPICDDEYFADDIVGQFVEFIDIVYGHATLEENLQFIANALGGKGSPVEVIRNYFLNGFYADHCKIYQKRPIYWLFDSGKKNGFKCLIYLHRYQPDTIARIRTDYVHEQQARYRTAIADLEQRINDASTSERVKLNKQLATLQAQATEIREYEEKIHHLADQMIKIDLDDGVKVNYAKFQDVLAKIK